MKPLLAAVLLAVLLGCTRTPPYQQLVEADSPASLSQWRSKHSDALTNEEWSLFDKATNAMKLEIMMEGKISGTGAVDQALCERIDGKKLCDVLRSGLQARLKKTSTEKKLLEEALAENSALKLKPGQDEKAQWLTDKIQAQTERLAHLKTSVAQAESDLRELELKFK